MLRYLPLVLATAAIAVAASWDFFLNNDIAGEAEAWKVVLDEGVPHKIGPWVGIDMPIEEKNRLVAGATGYVNRRYQHEETGNIVDLWLIVGHISGVSRHTPDVCYRNNGFKQQEQRTRYTFQAEGIEAPFFTSWFQKDTPQGLSNRRVFWAWALPKKGQPTAWQSPEGDVRNTFAGSRALFKMYFTTGEPEDNPPLEENPANELAELILPLIGGLFDKGIDEVQARKAAGELSIEPSKSAPAA